MDEGITASEGNRVSGSLGIQTDFGKRSGPELKGDYGRYQPGEQRKIFIADSADAPTATSLLRHELGHALDDIGGVFNLKIRRGEIPTTGIKKELDHLYDNLNNRMGPGDPLSPRKLKKHHRPALDGYPASDWTPNCWQKRIAPTCMTPITSKA